MPCHRLAAAMTVLLMSEVGCDSQPPLTASNRPVTVVGRVLDYSTNAAVAGASVAFGSIDGPSFAAVGTAVSDAGGSYRVTIPTIGQSPDSAGHPRPWYVQVDGASIGRVRLTDAGYRGDLFVHPGTCVARYGIVADTLTLRPVVGATVTLLEAVSKPRTPVFASFASLRQRRGPVEHDGDG